MKMHDTLDPLSLTYQKLDPSGLWRTVEENRDPRAGETAPSPFIRGLRLGLLPTDSRDWDRLRSGGLAGRLPSREGRFVSVCF